MQPVLPHLLFLWKSYPSHYRTWKHDAFYIISLHFRNYMIRHSWSPLVYDLIATGSCELPDRKKGGGMNGLSLLSMLSSVNTNRYCVISLALCAVSRLGTCSLHRLPNCEGCAGLSLVFSVGDTYHQPIARRASSIRAHDDSVISSSLVRVLS